MKAKKTHKTQASYRQTKQTRHTRSTRPMEKNQPQSEAFPSQDGRVITDEARGPMDQEGEGNRQSAQLAELEDIEPDIK